MKIRFVNPQPSLQGPGPVAPKPVAPASSTQGVIDELSVAPQPAFVIAAPIAARTNPSSSTSGTSLLTPSFSSDASDATPGVGLSPASTAGAIVGVAGTVAVIFCIWRFCNPSASRKRQAEPAQSNFEMHAPPYIEVPPPAYRP